MDGEISRGTAIKSLAWKFLERCSTQGVSFVVTIILARLLSPTEYGTIALVTVFVVLGNVVVEGGFCAALVQKKDADNIDFSTIFFSSLLISIILYFALFFIAPLVANFYNQPILKPVLRVLSINLLFGAVNAVQLAYMQRNLQFKKTFYSSFIGGILSGIIGISMAYKGYGVWALVGYTLSLQFFIAIILWIVLKWRPDFVFSWIRFKHLFDFGWKVFMTNFVISIYLNIRSLVIGKLYTRELLGLFDRGQQISNLIITNINGTIQSVMFPIFSKEQEDRNRLRAMLRRSIKTSCFVVFPLMIGLIVAAKPLVLILLSEKWISIVPFIQIFALANMFLPIQYINMEAVKSLGQSGILLKLELIKKVLETVILLGTMFINVYVIAWGVLLYNLICFYINLYPNRKLINYGYKEQLKNILPELVASISMGILIYPINMLSLNAGLNLLLQVLGGTIVYLAICRIFKIESFYYICNVIKNKRTVI